MIGSLARNCERSVNRIAPAGNRRAPCQSKGPPRRSIDDRSTRGAHTCARDAKKPPAVSFRTVCSDRLQSTRTRRRGARHARAGDRLGRELSGGGKYRPYHDCKWGLKSVGEGGVVRRSGWRRRRSAKTSANKILQKISDRQTGPILPIQSDLCFRRRGQPETRSFSILYRITLAARKPHFPRILRSPPALRPRDSVAHSTG